MAEFLPMMAIREPAGKFIASNAPAIFLIDIPAACQVWGIALPEMGSDRNT